MRGTVTVLPHYRGCPVQEAAGKPCGTVFLHDSQTLSFPKLFARPGGKRLQQQDSLLPRLLGRGGRFRAIRDENAAQPAFPELAGTGVHSF